MGLTQVNTDGVKDDAVTLAKQAAGTDGQVITYDASGNPKAIGPGTDGQVLTSAGAGAEPAFEDAVSEGTQVKSTGESGGTKFLREDGDGTSSWQTLPASGAALTGSTNNTVVTVTGADAMQGESKLTFDGNTLDIDNGGSPGVLRLGGNVNSSGRTNDTYKLARVVVPHYTNAEEPMAAFQLTSDGTDNLIYYGGGWGDANAVTVHRFYTATGDTTTTGTEQWRINASGNLQAMVSGNGIDFSATSDAGSSASSINELFSDYEEGSWTPTYSNDGAYVSTAASANKYIRVGNQVTVFGNLRSNENTAGNGAFYITSLPFASANHSNMYWCGTLMGDNGWTNTQDNMVCQVQPNSSTIRFWKNGNGNGVGNISFGGDVGIDANIMYSVTYHCA